MRYLGLDVGTTRLKCGVYNEDGSLAYESAVDYGEAQKGNERYVDIDTIVQSARTTLANAYAACPFDALAVSSLGESFVLLDGDDTVLFPPMLYTDGRGNDEAQKALRHADTIFAVAGVYPQGMYSAYKLLWIKNNLPALYASARKVMLVNEYIAYLLTGVRALDSSMAARTGIADVRKKEISASLCTLLGIDKNLFSPVVPCGSAVGKVRASILSEWGATHDVYVVSGGHDQVCAALGSGAVDEGACVDGMGTVECITALYRHPSDRCDMGACGYPNVPYATGDLYCTYLLNYTCGSLVRWWLSHCFSQEDILSGIAFAAAEKEFTDAPTGILVLPYFAGAATPYNDAAAKGAILNLNLSDSPSRIYQAILEGLCFEMRLNLETVGKYGIRPDKLIATGGGSHSERWLRIKADILNLPVYPLKGKEAGVCGAAMLACAAVTGKNLAEIARKFVRFEAPVMPRKSAVAAYGAQYAKYEKLYSLVKAL